jgi:hypothetical protein
LEGERRFCGNTTEELLGGHVIITNRELLATILDIRTVGCAHLTSEQATQAYDLYRQEYRTFAKTAKLYEMAAAAVWKKKAEEQAEAARCEAAAKKGTGEASSEAPAGEKKVFSQAGVAYGQSRWGAESVLSDSETGEDESLEQVSDDDFYKIEADKSLKAWSRILISPGRTTTLT